MERQFFKVSTHRRDAMAAVRDAQPGCVVEIKPPTRSLEQNAELWRCLSILSRDLPWDGERLTATEYKDLLTACLRKQKVVRGIEGGLVFLGQRSSQMTIGEFSELLELVHAFAAERNIDLVGDRQYA